MNIRRGVLIALGLLALLLFIHTDILSALIVFVFLGFVPGTDYVVPAWFMLPLFALVAFFAIGWIIRQPSKIAVNSSADLTRRHAARARVMRKIEPKQTTLQRYRYRKADKKQPKPAQA